MKIHPLRHGVSFHLSVSSSVPLKSEKSQQNELVPSSHKAATCTRDIIGYVPAISTVNLDKEISMFFECILL